MSRNIGLGLGLWLVCLGGLGASTKTAAADHAVTLMIPSKSMLQQLGSELPPSLEQQISGVLQDLVGPLEVVANENAACGIWLDWYSNLPSPIVFVHQPRMTEFRKTLDQMGVAVESKDNAITKIAFPSPIYYRTLSDWIYFSNKEEDLRLLREPLAPFSPEKFQKVTLQVDLRRVPSAVKTAIADHAARRILPAATPADSGMTPGSLIDLYVRRIFIDLAKKQELLVMTAEVTSSGFNFVCDITGPSIHVAQREPGLFQSAGIRSKNAIAFHTDLTEEETTMLSWWAHSLPDQFRVGIEGGQVDDRDGQEEFYAAVMRISQQVQAVVQTGTLEGFAAMVGENQDIPLVGIRIPSGAKLQESISQFFQSVSPTELSIASVEMRFEELSGVAFHRFNLASDNQQPVSVILGISDTELFITPDQAGLEPLRRYVANAKEGTEQPMPLFISSVPMGIESLFGWPTAEDQQQEMQVRSAYIPEGIRYEIQFERSSQ